MLPLRRATYGCEARGIREKVQIYMQAAEMDFYSFIKAEQDGIAWGYSQRIGHETIIRRDNARVEA